MADHPFSNAGLGMFGSAERQYAQSAMRAEEPKKGQPGLLGILASFLAKPGNNQYPISGAVPPSPSVGDTSLPSTSMVPQGVGAPSINPSFSEVGVKPYAKPKGFNLYGNSPFGGIGENSTESEYHPETTSVWGKPT